MKWTGRSGVLLGLLLWAMASTLSAAAYDNIDGIVAVVNDDVILRSELDSATRKIVLQMRESGMQMPPRSVLERQVLERLIGERLQLSAAKRAGIEVGDEMINRAIRNIASRNGMSLAEMRDVLMRDGVDFADFRRQLRDELTVQQLRDREVKRRIRITDQEVEAYLARHGEEGARGEYHLGHILIATPEGATAEQIDEARKQAQALATELQGGGDFAMAALTASAGRQALEGGDLGWRDADQLPTFFTDVVVNMKRGEVSDPIRTNSGFHIIKLEDYRGGDSEHMITQTKARHILIRTNEITSDADARTRLEQLRQRILDGADFATLAQGHSDDKGSAIKGGELGWVSPGDVVPEFEEQMNELQPNEISEPFKSEFGWHIVQVLERRQHDSTEEVLKNEARQAIGTRKLEEEYELYVRRLRDEAYVEIRLDGAE